MISERARAKINLTLHVTGKRADGYHLLDSIAVFADDVADVVTLRDAAGFSFTVGGPFASKLAQEEMAHNLAVRAAHLFAQETGSTLPFHLHLEKNIPLGAGLGGGSADAAAVVRALEKATGKRIDPGRRASLLLSLGADVPVCDANRACRFCGVGEEIAPMPAFPKFYLLLVWPDAHSVTRNVFKARIPDFTSNPPTTPESFSNFDDFVDFIGGQQNDLTEAACALYPPITQALGAIAKTHACKIARMSGSGSSVFGLYSDQAAAQAAHDTIKAAHPSWWCAVTNVCPDA